MKKKIVISNMIIVIILLSLFFVGVGSIYLLLLLAIIIMYQCVQIKLTRKLVVKIFLIIGAITIIIATLLFARKHHALSDKQLLGYGWKVYTSCESDVLVMESSDFDKIGKEWQISYRWLDNGVFLHVKNDSKSSECMYIAK